MDKDTPNPLSAGVFNHVLELRRFRIFAFDFDGYLFEAIGVGKIAPRWMEHHKLHALSTFEKRSQFNIKRINAVYQLIIIILKFCRILRKKLG